MSTAAAAVTVYASRSISWDTTILPSGATFPGGVLFPDTVLEERHDDDSVMTENPVEIGSVMTDHKFDLPQELELTYVWDPVKQSGGQPGFLESQYRKVLDLKEAAISLNVVTGKRSYQNMQLKGVSEITDKDTENVLMLRLLFRQAILALTQTVSISPAAQQSLPQKTMPTLNGGAVSLQPATNYNPGT
jgi:hypothetical protein